MDDENLEEQLLTTAREMIDARKAHFTRMMVSFEECVGGTPRRPIAGASTGPDPEVMRLYDVYQAVEKRLIALAVAAPSSPIAEAVRAYAHVYRPGREVSRSYHPDDPPEVIAAAKAVTNDYIRETNAAWGRLAELAGASAPDFTRDGARAAASRS